MRHSPASRRLRLLALGALAVIPALAVTAPAALPQVRHVASAAAPREAPSPQAPAEPSATPADPADPGGVLVAEIPWQAAGSFTVVADTLPAPDPARRAVTLAIRVEDGLGVDPPTFANRVMAILNDPRGWGPIDGVSFARTDDAAAADLVLTLASPATTDTLCAPVRTNGYVSCGRTDTVTINAARWAYGAEAFAAAGGALEDYRTYLISHEVGHPLGHPHEACPAAGAPAPVMLQQTLALQGCAPNGWPNP